MLEVSQSRRAGEDGRRSRTIIVAALACAALVSGSALAGAGPDARTSGSTKSKAKKALKLAKQNKAAIADIELVPGPQGQKGDTGPRGTQGAPGQNGADGQNGSILLSSRADMSPFGAVYAPVVGIVSASATETDVLLMSPVAGTAEGLRVNATGTDTNRTVTLRVNGGNTSLACSVTSGSPACSNTGSTVSISRDDFLSLSISGSADAGLAVYVALRIT